MHINHPYSSYIHHTYQAFIANINMDHALCISIINMDHPSCISMIHDGSRPSKRGQDPSRWVKNCQDTARSIVYPSNWAQMIQKGLPRVPWWGEKCDFLLNFFESLTHNWVLSFIIFQWDKF